jgi:hypothetical protein
MCTVSPYTHDTFPFRNPMHLLLLHQQCARCGPRALPISSCFAWFDRETRGPESESEAAVAEGGGGGDNASQSS